MARTTNGVAYEKRFSVSALTSTTGVTLVPTAGERKGGIVDPTDIEITYSVRPDFFEDDAVYDVIIRKR